MTYMEENIDDNQQDQNYEKLNLFKILIEYILIE